MLSWMSGEDDDSALVQLLSERNDSQNEAERGDDIGDNMAY